MNVSRRSSRLARKKRVDYNEENLPTVGMNLDQVKISESLKVKAGIPPEHLKVNLEKFDQFEKDANNKVQNHDSENLNKTMDLDCIRKYTFSNSEEENYGQANANSVNATERFRRRTKVDRIKLQQASEVLSELKSAIKLGKSAFYSLETFLKSRNKSLSDNNIMEVDAIDNERKDDDINSVMEYNDDNSHNLSVSQKESISHSEPVNKPHEEQINQEQFDQSEQVRNLMDVCYQEPLNAHDSSVKDNNSKHNYNDMDVEFPRENFKQPSILPRFTLKLSDDLKKDFQPGLPISTPLEDTEIIVYDSADPEFDKDDSIITIVEHKQNMTTTKKIRTTNEGLLSSESKKNSSMNSSFIQTNAYYQIIKDDMNSAKKQDKSNSKIDCINDEDGNLENQAAEEQNTHEKQDNTLTTNMGFTLSDEPKVQEAQCDTVDEHIVYKNSKDSTSKEVPAIDQRISSSTAKNDDDISNKPKEKEVPIEQEYQNISVIKRIGVVSQSEPKALENKNDTSLVKEKVGTTSAGTQIFKGQNATAVAKKAGTESSNVPKVQKSQGNSISNPPISFESKMDQNSQRSDLTLAKNFNTIKKNPSQPNKKVLNKKAKSTVKENPKNAKQKRNVEIVTESTSTPSLTSSSVSEVVSLKRSAPDDSKTSGDILGPILEMLDGNRKKLKKSETKNDETLPISKPVNNIPNLTDVPSNSRAETMNLPYSSMSAEEHREFLQIESMVYFNRHLVSKEQYDFYQNMLKRVMNERKNFEQWQFERSKLFLGHLNQLIENKVMDHLKHGRHSDINNYSVAELTIGLNPAGLDEPELKFKQKLSSIGSLFEFSIPSMTNQIPIPLEKELWLDDIQSINTIPTMDYWQKMKTPVVSQDPLIPTMLSNHKVDIVISSGSLAALVGLAESTDVELEVSIKIVEITKENSVLKTIYINKPFVKNQMTPREINQIYYNTAFESMTLKMDTCVKINDINVSKADQSKDAELKHSSNNLEYSLWSIGDISILIRCKSNGYFGESGQKVGIKTKLDYQLDYNYESITNVERARWWIYSFIRDKADLMLGRISVPMNTLCTIEKVSTEQILPDQTRVKLFSKRLHYIFKLLQCSLSQGSYILRHEKGEPYATVYRSTETADLNSQETVSRCIKIDRETIPFVPLVWKGIQTQITGTFPVRTDPIRTKPAQKRCHEFANSGKCTKKKCYFAHIPREKPKKKKKFEKFDNGCDDLQYIAGHVIESEAKIHDFDNVDESKDSSAPDFTTLLNNFNNK